MSLSRTTIPSMWLPEVPVHTWEMYKNIFINIHTHTSGGSSGSNNLSDES